ncbi:MAG: alpha/beta hydrolase [Saprospirales bacterium]|nr:alpha/beta hydrolase [Saprospirales bacterium]MBK8490976.1 alpha/beta hydrolase [Saprospirales bacterium]
MYQGKNIELLASEWTDPNPEQKPAYPRILSFIQAGFRWLGPLAPRMASRMAYRFFSTPRVRARHMVSDEWLEKAGHFEIVYRSLRLKGYEWGEGEQTILLVHGWESRGTALRSFVPYLLDMGFRVVAFDGPAHGDSDGKRTDLRHFAGAVQAVIRHLGGVHGIIAHSFGGASTLYALTQLDPGLKIEKLVLIAIPASMVRIFEETVRTLDLPPSVAMHFKNLLERIAGRPLVDLDAVNNSHQLNGQILLVHDKQDTQVRVANSLTLAAHWANAQIVLTNGYGHFRLMKNPDLLRRVGRFFSPLS